MVVKIRNVVLVILTVVLAFFVVRHGVSVYLRAVQITLDPVNVDPDVSSQSDSGSNSDDSDFLQPYNSWSWTM